MPIASAAPHLARSLISIVTWRSCSDRSVALSLHFMILVVRAGGPSAGSGYGSQSENGRDHKEDPKSPE